MKAIYVSKSGIDGNGMFAGESIPKGTLIQYVQGETVEKVPQTKEESLSIPNWYGISKRKWIDPGESPFRYLNHSCNPNAAISGTKSLYALRDINSDEEITIDYSMTDPDPLWEMPCSCGEANCRKIIRSIHHVPKETFMAHMPFVPRYFQRMYLKHYILGKIKSREG